MFKRIIMVLLTGLFLVSCSPKAEDQAVKSQVVQVSLDSLLQSTADYVGETVEVSGTIAHVCRHGGKKMFLFGHNPEQRIKITAGSAISAFDVKLEGSDVSVKGTVEELIVNEAYLDQQAEGLEEGGHENDGLDQGTHMDAMKNIENLRNQLKESGADHISFYSINCLSFEEMKQETM